MIARVRGVIAASILAGSRLPVSGSTSTKTGVAPACRMAVAVAIKVIGVVMTSSPGPMPSASRHSDHMPTVQVLREAVLETLDHFPRGQDRPGQHLGNRIELGLSKVM